MPERAPAMSASTSGARSSVARDLPSRNRRTAVVLVAWIVLLMLAAAAVAWLRN